MLLNLREVIMKKLLSKFKKKPDEPVKSRITSDTVAEHREKILAGGRRFKYPIQYAKHKLVINASIISAVALIILAIIGYFQLYSAQNTSEFMYRVTRVLPLPVAVVDGKSVLYSDYLMKYRSSIHYLEQKEQINLKTDDGKRQVEYIKQQSMDKSIADAYAAKLAAGLGVKVTDSEVMDFINKQRQSSDGEISEKTYEAVILDYYNWSFDEYKLVTKNNIIRQKVMYAIDKDALKSINAINDTVRSDPKTVLSDLVKKLSSDQNKKITFGNSGWVPKNNQDGGLATAASSLEKDKLSDIIQSTTGDGYYIVRLLDINDSQVKYEYVHVSLTTFQDQLDALLKDSKKTIKYIKL